MTGYLFRKVAGGIILTAVAAFAGLVGSSTTAAHASTVPSAYSYDGYGDGCWGCGGYGFQRERYWKYDTTTYISKKRVQNVRSYAHRRYQPYRHVRRIGRVHHVARVHRVAHVRHYRPYYGHAVRRSNQTNQTYFKRVHQVFRAGCRTSCWSCW